MAEFIKETATILQVHVRRLLASGAEKHVRQPYNLVTYDDNQQYIEPLNYSWGSFQWNDNNPEAMKAEHIVSDMPPFSGVSEIR